MFIVPRSSTPIHPNPPHRPSQMHPLTSKTPCTRSMPIQLSRRASWHTLCVHGALIGWLVARMPGYPCPEASPPWRKRCFRKRGLPFSVGQSSTDPRARQIAFVAARNRLGHAPHTKSCIRWMCDSIRSWLSQPLQFECFRSLARYR